MKKAAEAIARLLRNGKFDKEGEGGGDTAEDWGGGEEVEAEETETETEEI